MTIDTFTDIIYAAADFSAILPLSMFLVWQYRIKIYRLLFYETGIVFLLYIATKVIKYSKVVVAGYAGFNLYIYHLVGLVELVLIFLFYNRLLHLPKAFKVFFTVVVGFYILDSLFIEYFLETINAFGRSLSFAFLLSLTFYYLISIYRSEEILSLHRSATFWFNSGFMIYFSTSFFTFLFARQFLSMELSSLFSAGWLLHAFATIVKDIFLTIGLSVVRKGHPVMAK